MSYRCLSYVSEERHVVMVQLTKWVTFAEYSDRFTLAIWQLHHKVYVELWKISHRPHSVRCALFSDHRLASYVHTV